MTAAASFRIDVPASRQACLASRPSDQTFGLAVDAIGGGGDAWEEDFTPAEADVELGHADFMARVSRSRSGTNPIPSPFKIFDFRSRAKLG